MNKMRFAHLPGDEHLAVGNRPDFNDRRTSEQGLDPAAGSRVRQRRPEREPRRVRTVTIITVRIDRRHAKPVSDTCKTQHHNTTRQARQPLHRYGGILSLAFVFHDGKQF